MDTLSRAGMLSTLARATGSVVSVNTAAYLHARRAGQSSGSVRGLHTTSFDPLDSAIVADPYPAYARLLEGAAVHYNPRRQLWIVCRYDEVKAAARADDALSTAQGVTRMRFSLPIILTTDRPEHTRMRRQALPGFTRGALDKWRPRIADLAAELVGALRSRDSADAVAALAVPMPVRLIAHILGVPAEDEADFRRWSNQVVNVADLGIRPEQLKRSAEVIAGIWALHGYFRTQLQSGRLLEGDNVLSTLNATAEAGTITADELFWFAVFLLVAGNETTTNLLSTMLLSLAENPDQYELLRERPELIPSAVEEQLRFCSPIQGFYRTAINEWTTGGVTIPAGARVLLLFGAANRDPRHYPEPHRFNAARNPSDHLGFGSGIHLCLGAALARMEAQAVLRELVNTVKHIELDGDPAWGSNSALRGLTKLPVRLVPG